ncbi:hypothetical protein BDF22DRAFT_689646 [Syncephalis plumigaleata]|nr:hypothetical protein BDF22DRAFT_689646 [Syncephalis plumigaleata]
MAAIAVEPISSNTVDSAPQYNYNTSSNISNISNNSSKWKKQRPLSLRLLGLTTRSRSNTTHEYGKKDNEDIDNPYDTLALSKVFSRSQPSLLVDMQDKLDESNMSYTSDDATLSSSSHSHSSLTGSLSRFRRRWSSLGRKSKLSSSSSSSSSNKDQWWQEFERVVDPKALENDDESFTSNTNDEISTKISSHSSSTNNHKTSHSSSKPLYLRRKSSSTTKLNESDRNDVTILATANIDTSEYLTHLSNESKANVTPTSSSMSSDPGCGDLFPQYNQKRNTKSSSWFDIDPHTQRMADLSPGTRDYVLYQRMNQSDTNTTMPKLPYRPTRVQPRRPKLTHNNGNNSDHTNSNTNSTRNDNMNTPSQTISANNNATSFSTWPASNDVATGQGVSANGSRSRASRRKGLGSYPYGVHILTPLEEVTETESSDNEEEEEEEEYEDVDDEYTLSDAYSAITMTTTATASTTQLDSTSALLALDWRTSVQGSRDSGFAETLELADNKNSNNGNNKLDIRSMTLPLNQHPTTYCATTTATAANTTM